MMRILATDFPEGAIVAQNRILVFETLSMV